MKSMTIKGWLLATFFLSASQGFVQAQIVVGPPTFDSVSIPSTGGITYFVFSATVPDCDWLQADPVVRSERDFSVFVAEMRGELCPLCIDCYHQETSALVLGTLPAGDYQLSTYAPSPFAGGKRLLWTQPFSVPSDSGPTLIATLDGEAVRIDVRGVPAAHYVIEASANFEDWRPVYTAQGAPFAWTTNRTRAPFQFYRVAVSSGRR